MADQRAAPRRDGADPDAGRAVVAQFLGRTTLMLVLVTTAYFAWPNRLRADTESGLRVGGVVLAVAMVVVLVRRELAVRRTSPGPLTDAEGLLTVLYLVVVVWATVYHQLAAGGRAFAGMESKMDALYFTVTVLATVGFGDIHAVSPLARGLVTVQMIVNLIYIGTAVRALSAFWSPARPGAHPASRGASDDAPHGA